MRRFAAATLVLLTALLLMIAPSSSALNAAVAWRVNHAEKTITVTAYIAVYLVPAPRDGLQMQRYLEAVAAIEADIESKWNGKKFKCYDFVVDVKVRAASGPSDVLPTEFPVQLDTSLVPASKSGMEHARMYVRAPGYSSDNYLSDDPQWDPVTGPSDHPSVWELTSSPGRYAHEFGHLLGLDDNYVKDTQILRQGAADDAMRLWNSEVSDQTIVKAIRRSGEVDESLIKCPLDLILEHSEQNMILLTLSLEVRGCAPDYEPSSTDPSRPGKVTFSGEVSYTGSYLDDYPQIPWRVSERGGALSFTSIWRQPELDIGVSLEEGGQLRQGVMTKRVPIISRPDPVTLHNSKGVIVFTNILKILPRGNALPVTITRKAAIVFLVAAPVTLAISHIPSAEVQTAIAVLSERSVPAPIEGDIEIADGRFEYEQTCKELRRRYQAADAPIPSGSVTREDIFGNLQVEAPYGPAAVIMADAPNGSCEYQVAPSPTMVIATGTSGRIAAFSGVLCSALLGYPAVGGEYLEEGEPHAVLAILTDPDRNEWQIAIGPGSLEENLYAEDTGPDTLLGTFTGSLEDGLLIGDGQSDNGPLHLEMRCTPFRPVLNTG